LLVQVLPLAHAQVGQEVLLAPAAQRALPGGRLLDELEAGRGRVGHAGHGLDYVTAAHMMAIAEVRELNIGHFLIGEAVFVGLPTAIHRMRAAMEAAA
jgi:hypothetical protein